MPPDQTSALAHIDAYFDGWNAHDALAMGRAFAARSSRASTRPIERSR